MKVEAQFPTARSAEGAIAALTAAGFPIRHVHVKTAQGGRRVPIQLRHPVLQMTGLGVTLGLAAGALGIVLSGVFAPSATRWVMLGWGALAGGILGAMAGMGKTRLRLTEPAVGEPPHDTLVVMVDAPAGRVEEAHDILMETGGTPRLRLSDRTMHARARVAAHR